jgi:hypothetical protein
MSRRFAALAASVLVCFVAACGGSVTTQVFPVQNVLPEREEAVYRVQDSSGKVLGQAVITIAPGSGGLDLTQAYDFGEGKLDRSRVTVDRASMRPRSSERQVDDAGKQYRTAATYTDTEVSVTFTGEQGERTRTADISETAYDNLESLFLWRTMPMGAGERVSFVNVVVDPKRGTISRALSALEVSGRELVQLAEGPVEAWRVDFTSAGVTNRAWYAVSEDRRLVKYDIARGPTLLLERVSR